MTVLDGGHILVGDEPANLDEAQNAFAEAVLSAVLPVDQHFIRRTGRPLLRHWSERRLRALGRATAESLGCRDGVPRLVWQRFHTAALYSSPIAAPPLVYGELSLWGNAVLTMDNEVRVIGLASGRLFASVMHEPETFVDEPVLQGHLKLAGERPVVEIFDQACLDLDAVTRGRYLLQSTRASTTRVAKYRLVSVDLSVEFAGYRYQPAFGRITTAGLRSELPSLVLPAFEELLGRLPRAEISYKELEDDFGFTRTEAQRTFFPEVRRGLGEQRNAVLGLLRLTPDGIALSSITVGAQWQRAWARARSRNRLISGYGLSLEHQALLAPDTSKAGIGLSKTECRFLQVLCESPNPAPYSLLRPTFDDGATLDPALLGHRLRQLVIRISRKLDLEEPFTGLSIDSSGGEVWRWSLSVDDRKEQLLRLGQRLPRGIFDADHHLFFDPVEAQWFELSSTQTRTLSALAAVYERIGSPEVPLQLLAVELFGDDGEGSRARAKAGRNRVLRIIGFSPLHPAPTTRTTRELRTAGEAIQMLLTTRRLLSWHGASLFDDLLETLRWVERCEHAYGQATRSIRRAAPPSVPAPVEQLVASTAIRQSRSARESVDAMRTAQRTMRVALLHLAESSSKGSVAFAGEAIEPPSADQAAQIRQVWKEAHSALAQAVLLKASIDADEGLSRLVELELLPPHIAQAITGAPNRTRREVARALATDLPAQLEGDDKLVQLRVTVVIDDVLARLSPDRDPAPDLVAGRAVGSKSALEFA